MLSIHRLILCASLICASVGVMAEPLVSPADAERLLQTSEKQWSMEVRKLSAIEGVTGQQTANGSLALVTTMPYGAMTITPVYANIEKTHPNYLVLDVLFNEERIVKQLSKNGVLDDVCETALASLRPMFSAICVPTLHKDSVRLSFQISKVGRNSDLDALTNIRQPSSEALKEVFSDKAYMQKEIDRGWAALDKILAGADWTRTFTDKGPEICMRLAVAYRGVSELDVSDREALMFEMDVCMKAAAHRRSPQPEFKNPTIVKEICDSGYVFYEEICKRSEIRN